MAVLITILFFITQFTLGRLLGIDYETMTDNTDEMRKGFTLRFAMTATIFTLIGVWANKAWDGGVYVQDKPPVARWMWLIPILMIIASVARIAVNDWGARGVEYMIALGIGVLLVGVAEETTFRGIAVRAIRGSTNSEFVVLVVTSLLFGLVHGVNILNGAHLGETLVQIGAASIGGAGFYIVVRLTGKLVWAMLLHALWDFGILGRVGDADIVGAVTLVGQLVVWVLTAFAVIAIYRQGKRALNGDPTPST
ncbi:MAG: hypothetical protein DHS20C01_36320 [marine bacterium B5-7]|nr:MAG: hypothetical protein DHS20C01_36320 [marine bacterium B5-7]